jgi:hypothetical protein
MIQNRTAPQSPSERRPKGPLLFLAAASTLALAPIVMTTGASRTILSGIGVNGGAGALAFTAKEPEEEAPAFDRQVDIVYTVNNLGYTDTCG